VVKKLTAILLVSQIVVFGTVSGSFAESYSKIRLTDNSLYDYFPQISDNGDVVWIRWDGTDYEIFLFDSSTGTTTQLTKNDFDDRYPQINASGDVVWHGGVMFDDLEIFLFNSSTGTTTQLTDNDLDDMDPQINDNGDLVWYVMDGTDYEIYFFDSSTGTTTQLTDKAFYEMDQHKNANEDVVWIRWPGKYWEIFVFDSSTGTTTRLTYNAFYDRDPQKNDKGDAVWRGYDGKDWEIFAFDSSTGTTTQLTKNDFDDHAPQINNYGDVVWYGYDGTDSEIFLAQPSSRSPEGRKVAVKAVDSMTGKFPVKVTFDNVTDGGSTRVTTHVTAIPPPKGLKPGKPPTYYEITTTASSSGKIEVCIDYSGINFFNESALKLFHFEDSNWVDVTSRGYPDTVKDIICAVVDSFSPFAIFEPIVVRKVGIDIEPGSDPNRINLSSGGTVAVAIFSTATFDATTVDPLTVTLAGGFNIKGKATPMASRPMASFKDVNDDNLMDLVVHVSMEITLAVGNTEVELKGRTFDGTPVTGMDKVKLVP
jgi:hypothetical protein